MKGRILGLVVLLVWGLCKLPMETRLTKQLQEQRLGGFQLTSSLRQQAGQAGFVAVLGGLRAAVADLLWIRAHVAWQDTQYGRMKLYFDVCTTLQPRRELYWDMAAWHMAWNGANYMERTTTDPVERERLMQEYFHIGEDYLIRGTENCPDSWVVFDRLGALYRDKLHEPCKAAEAFRQASLRPGALDYTRRFAVYYLAECPGKEREAYEGLLALYNEGEREWLPTLLKKIQELERSLDVPAAQRVYIPPKERLPYP